MPHAKQLTARRLPKRLRFFADRLSVVVCRQPVTHVGLLWQNSKSNRKIYCMIISPVSQLFACKV